MDAARPPGAKQRPGAEQTPSARVRRHRPGGRLAEAKERFLSAEPVDAGAVRDAILASWARSRDWHVSADPFDPPFVDEPDVKSPLTHSAGAVLAETSASFATEPASLILTDAAGVVLDRRVGDSRLRQKLDRVNLMPGFSYAERFAGTNGIGTALEAGGPAQVFGHEHYVEHLEDLACAGAPIRHPVTGKLVGLVDLTCWREDANRMMIAVAATLAQRIEEALLADSGPREIALLRHYLAACRRSGGPVLALSHDLVMMNDRARRVIDPRDQAALQGVALDTLRVGRQRVVTLSLPSGATARLHCKPSWDGPAETGGVVQVQLTGPQPAASIAAVSVPVGARARSGAVGASPPWVRCCQEVEAQLRSGEWMDLHGEPGVGKLTVARAAHLLLTPTAHLRVLDTERGDERWLDELRDELNRATGSLVLTHVDRLPAELLAALTEELMAARERQERPWVVMTRSSAVPVEDGLATVIGCFPHSVQVPPLRHHIDDLPELVAALVARLTKSGNLRCSAEAMRVLMRLEWPGNVTQLVGTLHKTVAQRRTGVIGVADLPAECQAITRRVLTPLESMQRDAIVESLTAASGNRQEAARHLGMSRASIYRKIRQFGISVPPRGVS